MENRILVIGDIHGCLNEFNLLLKKVKYNVDKDLLILIGDYVDKGQFPKQTLEKVMSLKKQYGVIVLGGNHEDIFYNWVHNNDYKKSPYFRDIVGGKKTVLSYFPELNETNENEARNYIFNHFYEHLDFIQQLPYYYELDNFIFVHAGINPSLENWKNTTKKEFRWIREDFIFKPHHLNETVVFGHTRTKFMHQSETCFKPWFDNKKIGIDGACAYKGQLNCLIIDSHQNITYDFIPYQL